ncbi:MAG: TonB-dependent receptor, partial [Acidobacteriota bacterium]
MPSLRRCFGLGLILALSGSGSLWAQDDLPDDGTPQVEDVIVVTASRTEQRLQEVPVAMTVISAEQLETAAADNYGDILRSVPGVNVAQMSARDVQIAGRGATQSLSTSQLVLLDGRSVYLDFFGFVMWDLLPVDFREIAQVEVVRGPGSAVWGANALGGVVNLITKSPWEMVGTSVQIGAGDLDTVFGSVSHAAAGDDWGFKLSGSYYEQEPYERPTGIVPGSNPPTEFPPFENQGTEQPKIDLRYDRNLADNQILSLSEGWATTDGIVHTGIGPFDVDKDTGFSYFKGTWSRDNLVVNFFANLLDGEAPNLLTRGIDGQPLDFLFETEVYNLDFANTHATDRHTLTYGATARQIDFDLSIAPGEDERQEYGVFLQDEIELTDRLTWLVGARWDDIDPIGSVVSPRTSLLFAPNERHNFRVSYNKAFRAPSLVENFLDTAIVNLVDLGALLGPALGVPLPSIPYAFPSLAIGNPLLQEEELEAYEIGWVGTFDNRTTVTLALYRNELTDATDFFQASSYTPFSPPPGWPPFPLDVLLPPEVAFGVLGPLDLPSLFTYRNIGEKLDRGLEFSVDHRPSLAWSFNLNYSYQDETEVEGIAPGETNIPPENRFNVTVAYNGPRWYANASVNYVDEAFWTDVLDSRFWGFTDAYTVTNLSVGVRLLDDSLTLSLVGNNIFDEDVQQHIFGDIIS